MTTRHKLEMAVAALIVLMLIAALLLLKRDVVQEQEKETDTTIPVSETVSTPVSQVDPEDIPGAKEVSASTIARSFVERFGSYSSETDYINVDDVAALATASFARELEDLAERARDNATGDYYGVSTVVLSVKVKSETDTAMTMYVMTQREEAFDSPENTSVRYQDISIELVKEDDNWLVDGFTWVE